MNSVKKTKVRFLLKSQLGEGSFSKSFQAYDRKLKREVALKVEKENKNKEILKFEFEILSILQQKGDNYVPQVYEFIENKNSNFIVMELLGKNVATFKKSQGENFTEFQAYDILLQMLDSIEILHDNGYIHRDIKPTNFVTTIDEKKVYMVDFGLARKHLNENKVPIQARPKTEFRGTLAYASLNAHNRKELGRRDDLWSFFFVILELLNEELVWKNCLDDKDEVMKKKEECLENPKEKLLITTCKDKVEIEEILDYLKTLEYEDRPDYNLIRTKLNTLKLQEKEKDCLNMKNILINQNNVQIYQNNSSVSSNHSNPYQIPNNSIGNINSSGLTTIFNNIGFTSTFNTNPVSILGSCEDTLKIQNLSKKRRRYSVEQMNETEDFLDPIHPKQSNLLISDANLGENMKNKSQINKTMPKIKMKKGKNQDIVENVPRYNFIPYFNYGLNNNFSYGFNSNSIPILQNSNLIYFDQFGNQILHENLNQALNSYFIGNNNQNIEKDYLSNYKQYE